MPRSRSRSFESITRSTTSWLLTEDAALVEHGVDQRGLAVIDVGDDGDVALPPGGCALIRGHNGRILPFG